jgi:hypothetical protein
VREINIPEEEWKDWLQHPVTRAFRHFLRTEQEDIKGDWASGLFTGETLEQLAQLNSEAIGRHRQLEDIIELTGVGENEESSGIV